MTTDALTRQAFIGTARPTPERFDAIENSDGLPIKPDGGLWTSTLREADDGYDCAWVAWCRAERWGIGPEDHVFALDPDPDAGVVEIDGTDDLALLLDAYGRDDEPAALSSQFAAPDYEALREAGIDAVHLTARGQRETRFARPGLYGWDAESTVWLTWSFDTVETLGPVDEVIPE